jgi:TonB family protein
MRARSVALSSIIVWVVASQAPAFACPAKIGYAALQATGSNHGYREYVTYVDALTPTAKTLTFELALPDQPQPVRVDVPASRAILFVVPRADVSTIRLVGVDRGDAASPDPCDASRPYVVSPTKLTREFFFDDDAAWIKRSEITAVAFTPPAMTSILLTDLTAKARRRGLQGVTRVVAAIGPDGVVQDSELIESSGSVELDGFAMEAALRLRFTSARLPAKAGGASIGAVDDITLTFTPGMTSANAH